jgi:hypothetical protein
MKSLTYTTLTLLITLFFSSCEKAIDVPVREVDKKLVIEAVLTDQQGDCLVKISRTKSLSSTNHLDGVSGATVQMKEAGRTTVQLLETASGHYRANLTGRPGKTYELAVQLEGQTYTAFSKMPEAVAIDSLHISTMNMLGEESYMTNIVFSDPVAPGHAYRFVQYQNGKKNKVFTIVNDDLFNGRQNTVQYFNSHDSLKKGDHIRVQLQSIDMNVYKYWYSLWQGATGEGNAASPANPVSNIQGGALGYFSAHAVTEKETMVK